MCITLFVVVVFFWMFFSIGTRTPKPVTPVFMAGRIPLEEGAA
jgi:hypothetical protein